MPDIQPIGGMPQKKEPNVPEWAGKSPNLYGAAGAAYETLGAIPGTSAIKAGLGEAIGYPMPKVTTEMIGQEAMGIGAPVVGGLFSKTPAIAPKLQAWVRQHPTTGEWVAQTGGFGAEGRYLTSGKNMEEVMKAAKSMLPRHDIKVLRPSKLPAVAAAPAAGMAAGQEVSTEQKSQFSREEAIAELKRRGKWQEPSQINKPESIKPSLESLWSGQ